MLGSLLEPTIESLESPSEDVIADLLQATSPDGDSIDRRGERVEDASNITVRPASSSQRHEPPIVGRLRDAGPGGVGMLSEQPPAVGDVYLMTFDDSPFESDMVFARCMHCRLIREFAFESGFAFFSPAELKES